MQCVNLKWLSVKQNKLQSLKEAHNYFLEYISKAYQALTDPISRENFEKYGHHDRRQGLQMGIALPKFLLNIDGTSGAVNLLGIVGICIIMPLVMAVMYLSRSSKYNGKLEKNEASTSGTRTPSLNKRWVWGRGEKMFLGTHVQGKIPEVYGQQVSSKRTVALNVIKEAQNLRGTFRVILEIWLGVDMIKKSINILGLSLNNVSLG
ncbi:unnamed protein product [Lactuca virosa]|uniref:J domain-containing protein n=1 Tax=Lactuca virosa TaxID=75947 RepID=A0AAU9N522_9ASTR|nr:unnamed protein product [Lactuca virosa]